MDKDGDRLTVPMWYSELEAMGWKFQGDSTEKLHPGEESSVGTWYKDNFYITMGAAASLSLAFRALTTSAEDEFIAIAPYFPEYKVFVEASGATFKVVPADTTAFQIDFDALETMINSNTKGVIINSPNNPSGAVYSVATIEKLAALLEKKEKKVQE